MKFGKYEIEGSPHTVGTGTQCLIFFPNGYGASIVQFYITPMFSGRKVGSYGIDQNLWELAILKGEEGNWDLTYSTPIADDVIGHLTEDEVGDYLDQIQSLEPTAKRSEE